jgi:enamidase
LGWIDSTMHGGVTTMISAGEVHTPGRPRDIVGLKAMAVYAQRTFDAFRPNGVKIHAGAPVLEPGMTEADFKEMAASGVNLLGEVGLGGVKDGVTAKLMIIWARKYGIQSTIHTGGPSIPGSGLIGADVVLEADTDVVGHINGGHTALPDKEIRCICEGCRRGLELVHNGNERAALYTLRTAKEMGQLERVILGTDGPAGSDVQPLGIVRMVSMLTSLGDIPAEIAFLFRDRQYRADAQSRLRPDRARTRGRFCLHGQSAAFRRNELPQQHRARRSARHRHGRHRRRGADGTQPQYAAGRENPGHCQMIRRDHD